MKNFLPIVLSIALTICCWGAYGPLLRHGGDAMGGSAWRPFTCVGLAYLMIAVLLPALWLKSTTGVGPWTDQATAWSAGAGVAGSLGALGVILALAQGGSPLFVMPLVFGGAPVINCLLTLGLTRGQRNLHPMLLAGLLLVLAGAITVIVFNPASLNSATISNSATSRPASAAPWKVLAFIGVTVICWGIYGPILHRGQLLMQGDRLAAFLRVGLAYFTVALILPMLFLAGSCDQGQFTFRGAVWSLAGGLAGALGSFGMILAFTYGATPLYVMPLVFGGAPVINTLVAVVALGSADLPSAPFFVGLIIVACGAVIVLAFAPVNPPHKQP